MCPDSVGDYHEGLSSLRPGFESRSGRFFLIPGADTVPFPGYFQDDDLRCITRSYQSLIS